MPSNDLRLPVSSWRVLYAFAIVWMATFAGLAMFRSSHQHEFVSSSLLKFNVAATSLDPPSFSRLAHDASQAVVSEESLARLAAQAARRCGISLADLPAADELQQALQIVLKDDSVTSLSVSLVGDGKPHETALVNALASELIVELTRQYDGQFVQNWLDDFDATTDATRSVHLTSQLHEEIDSLDRRVGSIADALAAQNSPTEMTEQMKRLEVELTGLLAAGASDSNPNVLSIRQQLEWLRPQVAATPAAEPLEVETGPIESIHENARKNPYFTASERRPADPPARVEAPPLQPLPPPIDLAPLRDKVGELLAESQSAADVKHDLVDQLSRHFDAGSPLVDSLYAVEWAEQPQVQLKRNAIPSWAIMFSCVLAAAAAYWYDPVQDRLRLKNLDDVARRFHVEILGRLPTELPSKPPRASTRIAARCIRLSEWGVGLTLLIVGLACCAKPALIQIFLQDPLYGLSHWLALVLS